MSLRVPLVLQSETSECGLACLSMVLGAHGDHRGLSRLRQDVGGSARGMSLQHLVEAAGCVGLSARALRIELDDLRALRTPAVLHWNLQHFVVLVRCDRRGAVLHDPAGGRRRVGWEELSRCFSGVALELWPSPDYGPVRERPRLHWRRLVGPLPHLFDGLGRIAVLALMLEAVVLAAPLFMQMVIDRVLVAHDVELMTMLALGFLLLVVFQALAGATRTWSLTTFSQQLGFSLQSRLFRHLLRLPTDYFARRSLGEVLSRFESMRVVQRAVGSSMLESVLDGLMATLVLALMFYLSATLAWVSLGAMAIGLGVRLASVTVLRERSETAIVAGARQQTHSVESVRGMQTLRVVGGERQRFAQWQDLAADSLNRQLGVERIGVVLRSVNQCLVGVERIVVVWIAALLVLEGRLSVGVLIAYIAYRDQFAGRTALLIEKIIELRLLRVHMERLADVTDTAPEPPPAAPRWDDVRQIEVRAVSFRYAEGDPWVLRGLDLRVGAGEMLGIVGASGCGKSTLLKLVLGLLDATDGELRINGEPVRCSDRPALRMLCGVVMQDDQLFAGSIGENIACFDAGADPEAIAAAARAAAIDGDIRAMPMGYHTPVGDMGSSLSGGQKQRILLARALFRQPRLLLLDEATSHLDIRGERMVNAAIRALPCPKIVIAHRPETIAMCDRVAVLERGRIVREYRPEPAAVPAGPSHDQDGVSLYA